MSLSDPIADMITRIRNAMNAGHKKVSMPSSKQKLVILKILKDEGFISSYIMHENKENKENKESKESKEGKEGKGNKEKLSFPVVEINLKYYKDRPVISEIHRVSRPSLRYYIKAKDLKPIRNNIGISILSTPQGMKTNTQAKKLNLGGEVICKLW